MEFTRGIKLRSEMYHQRGKLCSGVPIRFARPRCIISSENIVSRRFETIGERAGFRRDRVSDASVADNGSSKAPRKLRNVRRDVTRNAGRVVKDERHLRGCRGFEGARARAIVTRNDLEMRRSDAARLGVAWSRVNSLVPTASLREPVTDRGRDVNLTTNGRTT